MISISSLPNEFITGVEVQKRTLSGIDELQHLLIRPYTSIKPHGHDGRWEIWIHLAAKTAYICPKGETHELVNNSENTLILMAIKGHLDYYYDDLAVLMYDWGFHVKRGSLIIN